MPMQIDHPNLTKSLQPLSHGRLVGDLSIFYRYFNGHCSQEIRDIIPVPLRRVRTTRSSTHSHPFQVSLPTSRTPSHKSSFIPRTCNLWNVLPSCFPESYNLPSFKSKINKLDLISLSSQLLAFFLLPMLGFRIGHQSLSSTEPKKNTKCIATSTPKIFHNSCFKELKIIIARHAKCIATSTPKIFHNAF